MDAPQHPQDAEPRPPLWQPFLLTGIVTFLAAWTGWTAGWCAQADWSHWQSCAASFVIAALVTSLTSLVPYAVLLALNGYRYRYSILTLIVALVLVATFALSGFLYVSMGV